MTTTSYTPLLGLALPVTGELDGTWGDIVNANITEYLDTAVAGALTVSGDVTLTKTTGSALTTTSSQYAILIASGHSTNITITAPATSKTYAIINTSGTYTVKIRGSGPTTGVTLAVNEQVMVAWNGTDFVKLFPTPAQIGAPSLTGTETLTNKTISVDDNTINGIAASSFVLSTAAGVIDGAAAQKAIPVGAVVGTTDSQTLTNKTLTTPIIGGTPATTTGMFGYDSTANVLNWYNGSAVQQVGYLNIPQNSQSAPYTLVLTDAGKHVYHPSADTTARIFTIPANSSVAFPIGTAVTFVNGNGAGSITISITSDTLRLAGSGVTGSRTLAANGMATAVKVAATEWFISGVGIS